MCAIEDAEPWMAVQLQTRKAAKEHTCTECGRTIRKGESHRWLRGMTDRSENAWSTYRTCAHCVAATEWMAEVCGGAPVGMLLEELQEHWDEGYRSAPFKLMITAMKAKWYNGRAPIPTHAGELARTMLAVMVKS